MSTNFAENDGTRLAWESRGAGTPLLMVMGHRWSRRMWHPIIDGLASKHRVIMFDNRGTGQSSTPPIGYSVGDMAEDCRAVLRAAGESSAHVYGVSMGGVIAQELALSTPAMVDHLILGCTAPVTADRMRLSMSRRVNYYMPDALINFMGRPLLYGRTSKTPAIVKDLAMLAQERTHREGLLGQATAVSTYDVDLEALRCLPHETLVLHGGKDKVVLAEWGRELAELIPNARAVVFDDAGHNYMATHAVESNAAVLEHLAS